MPTAYEPRAYWEDLLGEHYSASGVAYPGLARSLNEAMYRTLRASTAAALDAANLTAPRRVLDVGSGTGIWIDFWRGRGVQELVGVDLTQVAVENLRRRHPGVRFEQADAADALPDGGFDAISAMSVLLHITDDERFRRAVANLAAALNPGGALVLIEPVVVHNWWGPSFDDPAANSRARPLAEWQDALNAHGLRIATLRPATCLLANVVDTRRPRTFRLLQRYWELLALAVGPRERAGAAAGAALYALDRVAVRAARSGPSAKVLIARRDADSRIASAVASAAIPSSPPTGAGPPERTARTNASHCRRSGSRRMIAKRIMSPSPGPRISASTSHSVVSCAGCS
jgi:SAM-dependent methyltransferase